MQSETVETVEMIFDPVVGREIPIARKWDGVPAWIKTYLMKQLLIRKKSLQRFSQHNQSQSQCLLIAATLVNHEMDLSCSLAQSQLH